MKKFNIIIFLLVVLIVALFKIDLFINVLPAKYKFKVSLILYAGKEKGARKFLDCNKDINYFVLEPFLYKNWDNLYFMKQLDVLFLLRKLYLKSNREDVKKKIGNFVVKVRFDDNVEVRALLVAFISTLEERQDKLDLIKEYLRDKSYIVRRVASIKLIESGDFSPIAILIEDLDITDAQIGIYKNDNLVHLEEITGLSYATKSEWILWWEKNKDNLDPIKEAYFERRKNEKKRIL